MLSFCICDDDENICESLKNLLINYSFQNNTDFRISVLHDTESLLSSTIHYDVLFLDIRFDNQDKGIDAAHELRARGNNAFIIFLTTLTRYLPDGYKARAFRYLLKPINMDELYEAVDMVYRQLEVTDNYHARLAIKVGADSEVIQLSDIVAIESTAATRRRHIMMLNEVLLTKESLSSIYGRLPHNLFVYVHQRFIVNISHVNRVSRTAIVLSNDIQVPLGRKYKEPFSDLFKHYQKSKI